MQQSDKSDKTALGMIKQYFLDFGVLRDNPKEFWAVEGAPHTDFHKYATDEYEAKVLALLNRAFREDSD